MIRLLIAFCGMCTLMSCQDETTTDAQALLENRIIESYISDNGLSFTQSDTDLRYNITDSGNEARAVIGDTLDIYFELSLVSGKKIGGVFEEVEDPFEVLNLNLFGLGFGEGLALIGEGGSIDMIIPSNLAFGSSGGILSSPPRPIVVPPNATIVASVKIVDIRPSGL